MVHVNAMVPCTVTSASLTQVVCTLGEGPSGTYNLSVNVAGKGEAEHVGQQFTATVTFLVYGITPESPQGSAAGQWLSLLAPITWFCLHHRLYSSYPNLGNYCMFLNCKPIMQQANLRYRTGKYTVLQLKQLNMMVSCTCSLKMQFNKEKLIG